MHYYYYYYYYYYCYYLDIPNSQDKCVRQKSTYSIRDTDRDGIGDDCDNCPYRRNKFQVKYLTLTQLVHVT